MSYIIELPLSDAGRAIALAVAKQRKDDPNNTITVFSTKNANAIDVHSLLFPAKRTLFQEAEQGYRQSVLDFDEILEKLKNKSSHGLQLVRFKIVDEDAGWTPSTYSYYLLPLDGHLPPFSSENEIITMAENFINGETSRVAAGGTALVDIKKVDVEALLSTLLDLRLAKQATKDAMIAAQLELAEERAIVDETIESMWGDIQHASQDMPKTTAREFDTDWGVIFIHIPESGLVNIKAIDIDTNAIIIGAKFRIGLAKGTGGAKGNTNQYGVVTIASKNLAATYLNGEHDLYESTSEPITLIEGETINVTVKMKKKNLS